MFTNFGGCHFVMLSVDPMQIGMFFPSSWAYPPVVSLELMACSGK